MRLGEYETLPSGMLELWERVEGEWDKIPPEVCQNLIENMPRRVEAALKAKGGHTNTDNIPLSALDASATKLFKWYLGKEIILSQEVPN